MACAGGVGGWTLAHDTLRVIVAGSNTGKVGFFFVAPPRRAPAQLVLGGRAVVVGVYVEAGYVLWKHGGGGWCRRLGVVFHVLRCGFPPESCEFESEGPVFCHTARAAVSSNPTNGACLL